MKIISHIFNEIFDFFCGDWIIFLGVTFTILLLELLKHTISLNAFRSFSSIFFIIGITLSFLFALKRQIPR
jgi:hypothetical protein